METRILIRRAGNWGTIAIDGRWRVVRASSLNRLVCFLIDSGLHADWFDAFMRAPDCLLDVTIENGKIINTQLHA